MKKAFLLVAFLICGFFGHAQVNKADMTALLAKIYLGSGTLYVYNTSAVNSSDGLYKTYSEYDLAKCEMTVTETSLIIEITADSGPASLVLCPFASIGYVSFYVKEDKTYFSISLRE